MAALKITCASKLTVGEILVIPLCNEEMDSTLMLELDRDLDGALATLIYQKKFAAEKGQIFSMTTNGRYSYQEVLLIGLGPLAEITPLILQEAGALIWTKLQGYRLATIACYAKAPEIFVGLSSKSWSLDKYLTHKEDPIEVYLVAEENAAWKHSLALTEGIAFAKELAAEPANRLFPMAFANRCLELQTLGVEVEILTADQLQQMGAESLYAVGKGSANPPCLVSMHWKGEGKGECISLVGKGVCYDAGGINIKTSHLLEMKWDKASAAAVTGLMAVLAKIKWPGEVVGIIGLAENLLDGACMRPGDVIRALSGTTIEIVDTDNEGRLVLADCLWYAQEKFHPKVLLDLGTLTLETMGALAGEYAGLYTNDEDLANSLVQAGQRAGEKLWRLPMGAGFAQQIRSPCADIKNMGLPGFGEGGAAAEFLKRFIQPQTRWAHLDIAGVAWTDDSHPLHRSGVTGFGLKLLYNWITAPE